MTKSQTKPVMMDPTKAALVFEKILAADKRAAASKKSSKKEST